MEPNQQNVPVEQVSPASNSHLNLLPTIIVGIVMLLLGLGGGYLLFANKSEMKQVDTSQVAPTTIQEISPTSIASPTIDPTADWKTYSGSYLSFKHPPVWNPTKKALWGGGEILEGATLGIPGVSESTLSFSDVDYLSLQKPEDIIQESSIIIGGRTGVKWKRQGDAYFTYDYLTYGSKDNKDSFEVHVTKAKEDKNLEKELDNLVQSIQFKTQ